MNRTIKSILQTERTCLICGSPQTETHHVFFGTSNRKISDREGFIAFLCPEHHRGEYSPHHDRDIDLWLKKRCQTVYEETHTRQEFIALIGKSYL